MTAIDDIVGRWPGQLQPIVFEPRAVLPDPVDRFCREHGLPASVEVEFEMKFRLDEVCRPLPEDYIPGWSLPKAWRGLWRLATIEWSQPIGDVVLEELTGKVYYLDVEQGDNWLSEMHRSPIELLHTFVTFVEWHQSSDGDPAKLDALRSSLVRIGDHQEGTSFWGGFVDLLQDMEFDATDRLTVTW